MLTVYGTVAITLLVGAMIGYGIRSVLGFLRTKQKYQLSLTQNLYFQNLDNNAGVLFRLLDEAEAQEFREAALAYFLLWQRAGPSGWTVRELDHQAEAFLLESAKISIDFEVEDAVEKLQRLRLIQKDDSMLHAANIDLALVQLDRAWNDCFQ